MLLSRPCRKWTAPTASHREASHPHFPRCTHFRRPHLSSLPCFRAADFLSLEAQQRYFSYRAILVAMVSQNSFVLVFMGYRTIIARYVAKWGIARMCLCKTKYQGGVSHPFVGVLASLKKYRAIWGIAAIVSQYRAIWGH